MASDESDAMFYMENGYDVPDCWDDYDYYDSYSEYKRKSFEELLEESIPLKKHARRNLGKVNFEDLLEESYTRKPTTDYKKQNTIIFIDAESIGADHVGMIIGQGKSVGEIAEIRYYARQNDPSTQAWKSVANEHNIRKFLISGGPSQNKIDLHIIKDAKKILETMKNIDIFCIASRDGDYKELVDYLRERGKRVVVMATKQTSQKLKAAASEVKGI